jgi:hypothetical protein
VINHDVSSTFFFENICLIEINLYNRNLYNVTSFYFLYVYSVYFSCSHEFRIRILLILCKGKKIYKISRKHFCIHAGGRAVIDELQKSLKLSAEHVEASRMALHRFGNTSSLSLWYELSYIEAKGRMKKGDRIWQIGFGSGFKCNSAVWKCNRTMKASTDGAWIDCIDRYPVYIPEVMKL